MNQLIFPTAARRAVSLLFLMNGILFATWASRIPGIQASLGLSHGVLGLALLSLAAGALLAMPVAGWLSSRFGSARVCAVAGLADALALASIALATGPFSLAVILFIFGASNGALGIAMNAHSLEVEQRYGRPIVSTFHALFSLGALIGSAIGGALAAAKFSLPAHFGMVTLCLIVVGAFWTIPALLPHRPLPLPPRETRQTKRGFAPMPLLILGLLAFCVNFCEGTIANWGGLYMKETAGASEGMAAVAFAAFSIAMATCRFFGDILAIKVGPAHLTRWGGTLAATGLALALFFPIPAVVMIGFAIVGAGISTIIPQIFSASGRATDMPPSGAIAIVATIAYVGFLFGPPIIGFLAEFAGLRGAMCLVVLTSTTVALLASHVGARRTKVPVVVTAAAETTALEPEFAEVAS